MPDWLIVLLVIATVLALMGAAFDAGCIHGAREQARRHRR
jgi:hypothetical protein